MYTDCGAFTDVRRGIVAAYFLLSLAGCSGAGPGESETVCASRIEFKTGVYQAVANVQFEAGERIGSGETLGCSDDDGHTAAGQMVEVFAVHRAPGAPVIAVGGSPRELFALTDEDGKLAEGAVHYIESHSQGDG
jgi:hypothetical protein